jgi:hypothetical protein
MTFLYTYATSINLQRNNSHISNELIVCIALTIYRFALSTIHAVYTIIEQHINNLTITDTY